MTTGRPSFCAHLLTRELLTSRSKYTTRFLFPFLTPPTPPEANTAEHMLLLKGICKAFVILGHVLMLCHENGEQRVQ